MSGMSFQHVKYFLTIVRERNFTRAARRCGVRQPSLSHGIRELEHALGAPLFERSIAGAELTALGRAVKPYLTAIARSCLRAEEVAQIELKRARLVAARATTRDRSTPSLGGESAGLIS